MCTDSVVPDCSPKPECIPIFKNLTVKGMRVENQVRALPDGSGRGVDSAAFTLVGLPESAVDVRLEDVHVQNFVQAQECVHAQVQAKGLSPPLAGNSSAGCVVT